MGKSLFVPHCALENIYSSKSFIVALAVAAEGYKRIVV